MTRKSPRELEKAFSKVSGVRQGDDVIETVPDGSPEEWYREDIERARDVLPPADCDRLDRLLERIDETGAYKSESDSGLPEPTGPHKDLMCMIWGEVAEQQLEEMKADQ